MHVVFLTPWYPTADHRYSAVFVREYARALQRHCNVTVLHCGIGDLDIPKWWASDLERDDELAAGVLTYRVRFRPSKFPLLSLARNVGSVRRAVRVAAETQGRPELIHAHVFITGWAALAEGRLRDIPVIVSEHWSAFARGILPRSQKYQARMVYRLADRVLPVSHALQKVLEANKVKARFEVIPNVVDTGLFGLERVTASRETTTLRILVVTSLVEYKGVSVLLLALKNVEWNGRAWRVDVVGDGDEAESLQGTARAIGMAENVIFHGQRSKKEIAGMMRDADLFVLPSLVETFSVATAEALVSGLPSVVTRCGGPEELVDDQSGIVVAPGDSLALSRGITDMIKRLPTFNREAIALHAKKRFGSAAVSDLLYSLYRRLIDTELPNLKSGD
jgi:L-malate glycosyltransferase